MFDDAVEKFAKSSKIFVEIGYKKGAIKNNCFLGELAKSC